jgi:hypothetical protein
MIEKKYHHQNLSSSTRAFVSGASSVQPMHEMTAYAGPGHCFKSIKSSFYFHCTRIKLLMTITNFEDNISSVFNTQFKYAKKEENGFLIFHIHANSHFINSSSQCWTITLIISSTNNRFIMGYLLFQLKLFLMKKCELSRLKTIQV